MIYDCFLFYKELDLLEIRLNILNDYVDYFVITESTKSFTGRQKPLFYEENKGLFKKFEKKIIHVIISDDPPQCESAWDRETFQRNAMVRGLKNGQANDIILMSDLDEIPNPSVLKNIPRLSKPIRCQQLYCYYYFNNLNLSKPWWSGTRIVKHAYLKKHTPQEIRKLPRRYCRLVGNGGWHFSFLGDAEFIADKIRDCSHQEFNNDEFNTPEKINKALETGQDMFGRNYEFGPVKFDGSFPTWILQNKVKYNRFILSPEPPPPTAQSVLKGKGKPSFLQRINHKITKRKQVNTK